MTTETKLRGARILAVELKKLDVEYVFGVVGIPVMELAEEIKNVGIFFVSFRNEQSAVSAACSYTYLASKPGICLTVSGPGFTNALTGLYNSKENNWPILLISGSTDLENVNKGGFQELDQISLAKKFCGLVVKIADMSNTKIIHEAYFNCCSPIPSCSYIDFPGNLITRKFLYKPTLINNFCTEKNDDICDSGTIKKCVTSIEQSNKPIVIIGKGASYNRCEKEILHFVEKFNLCFVPMPMAKGLIPDEHKLCVSAARSYAFKNCDLVIVLGARFNWMLNYGKAFKSKLIIHIDINKKNLIASKHNYIKMQKRLSK